MHIGTISNGNNRIDAYQLANGNVRLVSRIAGIVGTQEVEYLDWEYMQCEHTACQTELEDVSNLESYTFPISEKTVKVDRNSCNISAPFTLSKV